MGQFQSKYLVFATIMMFLSNEKVKIVRSITRLPNLVTPKRPLKVHMFTAPSGDGSFSLLLLPC